MKGFYFSFHYKGYLCSVQRYRLVVIFFQGLISFYALLAFEVSIEKSCSDVFAFIGDLALLFQVSILLCPKTFRENGELASRYV
jgi:hypothetical protein